MALSDMTVSIQDCVQQLKNINLSILKGRLERGNILKHLKDNKAYVGYDSYCDTWQSFLEAIGINRETARQDMEIYDQFSFYILGKQEVLQNCSYERLVRLLPIAKQEPQMKTELIDMAVRSNRADFDNNIRELKGMVATDTCDRHFEKIVIYEKCLHCGEYRRKD
jgi:hypothetical protein